MHSVLASGFAWVYQNVPTNQRRRFELNIDLERRRYMLLFSKSKHECLATCRYANRIAWLCGCVLSVLHTVLSFKGKASRKTWWSYFFFMGVISLLCIYLIMECYMPKRSIIPLDDMNFSNMFNAFAAVFFSWLILEIPLSVKRLKDIGIPWWFFPLMVLAPIPVASTFYCAAVANESVFFIIPMCWSALFIIIGFVPAPSKPALQTHAHE